MAVTELKHPKEDRFEELVERIAAEINEHASRMNPMQRVRADSDTTSLAVQVQRRDIM
jgi:hypothetical protein